MQPPIGINYQCGRHFGGDDAFTPRIAYRVTLHPSQIGPRAVVAQKRVAHRQSAPGGIIISNDFPQVKHSQAHTTGSSRMVSMRIV